MENKFSNHYKIYDCRPFLLIKFLSENSQNTPVKTHQIKLGKASLFSHEDHFHALNNRTAQRQINQLHWIIHCLVTLFYQSDVALPPTFWGTINIAQEVSILVNLQDVIQGFVLTRESTKAVITDHSKYHSTNTKEPASDIWETLEQNA